MALWHNEYMCVCYSGQKPRGIPEANMLRKKQGRSREVEAVGERQSAHGTNKISNLCCRAGSRAHGHCHYEQ